MAIKLIQSLAYHRLVFDISSKLNGQYQRKLKTISNFNYPFVIHDFLLRQVNKHGYNLRPKRGDYDLLLLVDFLGLESFKIEQIKVGLFNPINQYYSLQYLVELGFFTKDKGTYKITEKYSEFLQVFSDEYYKVIRRFSDVEKIGKRRKKLRDKSD